MYYYNIILICYYRQQQLERDNTTVEGPSTPGRRGKQRETKQTCRDVLMKPTLSVNHSHARKSGDVLLPNSTSSNDHNRAQESVSQNHDETTEALE